MSSANEIAYQTLKAIPAGSLLRMDYEPADGVREEIRKAAQVFGMDPRTYFLELLAVWKNGDGQPLIRGRVLNRGNEERTFNPIRGTLTRLDVLRFGPAPGVGARS